MSHAALTARLVEALEGAAVRDAEGAALVSATFDVLTNDEAARIETRVVRRTRTLLFMSADARNAAGACVATASSVHKISA